MLSFKKAMLFLLLFLVTVGVNAQQKKVTAPAVFSNFSPSIDFSEAILTNAMQMFKGQQVAISFGNDLNFPGEVLSNEIVFENLQTIIIKSSVHNNALLQISKQINADKSISFVGRIFSQGGSDGYQLKKTLDGNYQLQKFETAQILQDCELH